MDPKGITQTPFRCSLPREGACVCACLENTPSASLGWTLRGHRTVKGCSNPRMQLRLAKSALLRLSELQRSAWTGRKLTFRRNTSTAWGSTEDQQLAGWNPPHLIPRPGVFLCSLIYKDDIDKIILRNHSKKSSQNTKKKTKPLTHSDDLCFSLLWDMWIF